MPREPQKLRCKALSGRTKEPCKNWAIIGLEVCRIHGGSSKVAKAKAARVVEERKLAAQAAKVLGTPIMVDPVDALLGELHWTAGHVAWLRDRVQEHTGMVVSDIARVTAKDGPMGFEETTVREARQTVWYRMYAEERDRLVKISEVAIRAGVEERRVRLAEAQGQIMVVALQRVLERLNLTSEQVELVPRVVPGVLRELASVGE